MKRVFVLLLMLKILSGLNVHAQQTVFSGSYGNSVYNEGIVTFQLADSTYLVAGNSMGFLSYAAPYIARIDRNGVLISDVMISRPWLINVKAGAMKDSLVYLTGITMQGGSYNYMFMCTDLHGNVLSESYWGGQGWNIAHDIVIDSDDRVFIVGEATDTIYGNMNAVLMCLDTSGVLLWSKEFGGAGHDAFYAVDTGHAQTLIMAGATTSQTTTGDSAFYIVNTDKSGNLNWTTIEDYPGMDIITDIHPDITGGYYMCGQTAYWQSSSDLESFLMRVDGNGNFMWISQLGADKESGFNAVIQLPDSTYRMAGYNNGTFSSGKRDAFLQNADKNGLWSSFLSGLIIGGLEDDWANSVISTFDGGFLLTGTSKSFGPRQSSIYVVKTDSIAQSSSYSGHQTGIFSKPESFQTQSFKIFPNPVSDELTISTPPSALPFETKASIMDLSGRIINEAYLNFSQGTSVKINTAGMKSGLYLMRIEGVTIKFLKI